MATRRKFLGGAVLPSVFRQDPRYFYMGPNGTTKQRLRHALLSGVLTRADSGRMQLNYSHILGNAGACALSVLDRQTGRVEHGVSCAGCQLAIEKDIASPWASDSALRARDKVYARDNFLDHFRWCQHAQLLWESSDEGRRKPPELPELARKRGYFRNTR